MNKKLAAISKLTFQKEFYSDVNIPDMIFAKTIRAPVEKGIITSISHNDLPEGYSLITARDVPGSNLISTPAGNIPIFCDGNISYLGEPIALLTGPNEEELETLSKEINIAFDKKTIEDYLVTDETSSKKRKARTKKNNNEASDFQDINEQLFSDIIATRTIKKGTFPDEIKIENCKTIENEWKYELSIPNYGEPSGAICFWKNQNLTVITATQWPSNLRSTLSLALNISDESINIKKTASFNRGSNCVWFNSIISTQVAVAALKLQKPVKLVYTRSEQKQFLETMQPILIKHKTIVSENGKIEAEKIDINVDAGFSNPFAQEIIDRLTIASSGIYSCENLFVEAKIMRTHKSASSIDLQQLEAASFFAIENQMNCIAEECNLTPIEIRVLNLNSTQNSKKGKNQFILNTDNASEMFNFIASQSDFNRKHASFKFGSKQYSMQEDKKETSLYSTHLRGIGISYAWEGSGYFGSVINDNSQTLEVSMENDMSITIHCPPVSPMIQNVWTKIALNILGLNPSQIKFDTNYKTYQEPQMPESIYSNISIMTSLLTKCCEFLRKNKSAKKLPLTVKRQISANKKKEWNNDTFTGNPFHGLGTCCATVELEINPFTLKEEIKQIVLFIDGGKMLNPQDSEMTIKLEIENILSALVQNEICICDNIKINFLQSNREPTQIGELVYQVIPAAFTQALSQALGNKISTIPLNAETIYENLFNTNVSGGAK